MFIVSFKGPLHIKSLNLYISSLAVIAVECMTDAIRVRLSVKVKYGAQGHTIALISKITVFWWSKQEI